MVITDVNQVVYLGDGVTTAFPFTFRIIDATDIQLLLIDEDGTETDITSDYFVDINTNTVHYPGYAPGSEPAEADQPAPVQTGQKLMIYRKLPITQEKDLGDKWPFYVIELGLDKLTMILQDIWDWCGRCLQVSRGQAADAGDDFDPTVPLEAGKVVIGNNAGTGFSSAKALLYENDGWNAEGQSISNVATPGKVKDATTKEYVDNLIDKLSVEADRYVVFDNVAAMKAADLPAGYNTRTLGYYDINDGGAGVYSIRGKEAGETEDGESIIFLHNGNVAERISYVQGCSVCPDNFAGADDSVKIQACLDALVSTGGTILINREYILTADIIHKIDSNKDLPIQFIGVGKNAKINMGAYAFKGDWDASARYQGNLFFSHIWFTGTGTAFDCDTLIRLYFNTCYFTTFDKVFACTTVNSARFQTIYVQNCVFRRCGDCFYKGGDVADVHIINNNFEWCDTLFTSAANDTHTINGLFIIGNLVEGMQGEVTIRLRYSRKTVIDSNYFESNHGDSVIDADDINNLSVTISNNSAFGSSTQYFVFLPRYATTKTLGATNVIENNSMIWKVLNLIGFSATPIGRCYWRIGYNYANELSDVLLFCVTQENSSKTIPTLSDFNDAKFDGNYLASSLSIPNAPVSGTGMLTVTRFDDTHVVQEFNLFTNATSFYRRTGILNQSGTTVTVTWQTWMEYSQRIQRSFSVDTTTDGIVNLPSSKTFLISVSIGTNSGLYIVRSTPTGNGTVSAISALAGAGTMTLVSNVFKITHVASSQVVHIMEM